jgi:NAD(P)-dependent dehydrogenase (short-subunit alcohol dehydrogenase family)
MWHVPLLLWHGEKHPTDIRRCARSQMVANAGIFLMKSFVDSLFYILLVNYIGLTVPYKATAEDLDRIIGVNLRGTFLCYKYAGLQMISQGRGGRIIGKCRPFPRLLYTTHYVLTHEKFHTGACSGSGKQGYAALSAYSSSKFGIRGLTQCAGASRLILLSLPSAPVQFAC